MSVGATSGVELGAGRSVAGAEGSEFHQQQGQAHYGGVRGGISTGEMMEFRIIFRIKSCSCDFAT